MFEGNIAGLLGMSNKSDGTGDYDFNRNGSYRDRVSNRDRHYYKTVQNIDTDTGEVLDFKPQRNFKNPYKKMAYSGYRRSPGFSSISSKLPKPKQLFDIAILGAIAYGGYIVYNKFLRPLGNSPLDDVKDKASNIIAKSYVDSTSAAVTQNNNTATSLASSGYAVSSDHIKTALLLHGWMNTEIVNHTQIVKTIQGMSKQTFQLVASAYGTQNLNTYAKSPTHLLTFAAWEDLFSSDKLVGTLKKHLSIVLSSSELSSISSWLNLIS